MLYRYEYPDQFAELDRPDFARFSGNIVLWGAGKIGSITAHVLRQKGIDVLAFVDMSEAKQGSMFCGLKIISPETFLKEYHDAKLIITTIGRDDVIEWLAKNGFTNYYDAWPLLLEFEFGDYDAQNQMYMSRMIGYYLRVIVRSLHLYNKYTANRLRVMVTSRCTLRCKECSTFVPYVQKPRDDDWEMIVSDVITFLDAVGELQEVEFLGGEPLLHPDLDKIISGLKNERRIKQIAIISNGTIVPTQALVQALKGEPRILFRISNYGKLSSKIREVSNVLEDNGIPCEIINYSTWYKSSELKIFNESSAELKKKFNYCMQGCGIVSWSGKLFFCATLPFLVEVNAFPEAAENFYDMRNKSIARKQLLEEIYTYIDRHNTDEYIDACKYCSGKTSSNFKHAVPAAEQVKGILKMPAINIV